MSIKKPSKQAVSALTYPATTLNDLEIDEFGFVVMTSQRAHALSLGAEPTLDVPTNTKQPILALMEVADKTVSLEDIRQNYITKPSETVMFGHSSTTSGSTEDKYEQYMQEHSSSQQDNDLFDELSALFENPND